MENVIDKLRKLMAMQESAKKIGNLAEAEAFAAKAQELLTKYKLEMTDVEYAEQEAAEPIMGEFFSARELLNLSVKKRHDNWIGILINAIAEANFCKVIRSVNSNAFRLVGRATDRTTTKNLFEYLSRACIEMAPQQAEEHFGPSPVPGMRHPRERSFISSFKLGFAGAIYDRLEVKKQELRAGAPEQGLMRIDQLELAVKKTFEDLFPDRCSTAPARSYHNEGYDAGTAYGSRVGINSTKRLGAGA